MVLFDLKHEMKLEEGAQASPQPPVELTKIMTLLKGMNKSNRYRWPQMTLKSNRQHAKGKIE